MPQVFWDDVDRADPYSACTTGIMDVLTFGFEHKGEMNETEYETLKKIEEVMRTMDNA